ncbi:ABIfamily member 3-like protein [Cricetulus griseus]|nr:ABIfamily member 3-like protein [Cricetulus griseus]
MAELQQLQEFDIPTGREALRGNHSALLRVANYCEDNYVQATDKRKALEETMAFTTQALASVAYQVGNLAGHTLRMLDLQGAALRQVEAKISTLSQMVNMHMEKVARREIGTLATVMRLPPSQKVIPPESLPPLTPYYRKPLNFSCLDDIGHGIKDLSTQLSRTGTLGVPAPSRYLVPNPLHPHLETPIRSFGLQPCAPQEPPGKSTELPLPPPPALEGDELGLLPPPPPGFGPDEPSWVPAAYLEKASLNPHGDLMAVDTNATLQTRQQAPSG